MSLRIRHDARFAAACVLLLLGCNSDLQRTRVAKRTTICSVVESPLRYDGELIEVEGFLSSDGIEHMSLYSKACAESWILVVPESRRPRELGALKSEIANGSRGTLDKEISGTFVGIFEWRLLARQHRRIDLLSATNLKIKRLRTSTGGG